MAQRIDVWLNAVEPLLLIYEDGFDHWEEKLPPFKGKPRRWPLDDQHANTVGEMLLSRYGGYDWWTLAELLKADGSLDRAFRHERMTTEQEMRYRRCLDLFARLQLQAEKLGVIYDWKQHAMAPALVELRPDHPSVKYLKTRKKEK